MLRAGGGGGGGTVAGKAAATRSATLDQCRAERGRMGPGRPAAAAASGGTQPRSSLCPGRNVESAKPLAERAAKLVAAGGYAIPESQTPWQQYFRELVGRFDEGMTLRDATNYNDISRKFTPRDSH